MTQYIFSKEELRAIVNETLEKELLLKEEKGINDDVALFSKRITNAIKRKFLCREGNITNHADFSTLTGTFSEMFPNLAECNITYYIDIFPDEEIYNRLHKTYGAMVKCREHEIIISTFAIRNKLDIASISDSVQHEVEHLFQFLKSNNELLSHKEKFYNQIKKNLGSKDNNGWNNRLAIIGYLSLNEERCGIINGMYAYLTSKYYENGGAIESYLQETEAYKYLIALDDINYCFAIGYYKGLNEALEEFKPRDAQWFQKACLNDYVLLEKQIVKCLDKINIDIKNEKGIFNKGTLI